MTSLHPFKRGRELEVKLAEEGESVMKPEKEKKCGVSQGLAGKERKEAAVEREEKFNSLN